MSLVDRRCGPRNKSPKPNRRIFKWTIPQLGGRVHTIIFSTTDDMPIDCVGAYATQDYMRGDKSDQDIQFMRLNRPHLIS